MYKIILKSLGLLPVASFACGLGQAHAVNLPDPLLDTPTANYAPESSQVIVLGGGCFWGVQAVFQQLKGVKDATSGYAGGNPDNANYDAVSSGITGHAEVVRVTFDPAQISLGQILKVYFSVVHDPTELNRQGPDSGTQYRSVIFFSTPEQEKIARAYIEQLDQVKVFTKPIVTQVSPLNTFFPAEDYHQNYATLHPDQPYIVMHDLPKIKALREQFPEICVKK